MLGHPLFWLLLATLIIAVGFGGWNILSTRRRHKFGPDVSGVGGRKDPLSGDS